MSLKTQKNRSKSSVPLLLAAAGLVLLVLAASLILFQPPQSLAATKTPEPQHSVEETFPEISRISLADSKTALDNGKAIFIDVRDTSAYAEAHIPGALSIPLAELEERVGELDPSQWIITYCTWPSEESSARAARILLDNGFKNVTPLLGGFNAWREAEHPIESGK